MLKADWSGKTVLFMSLFAWLFVWLTNIDFLSPIIAALYFVILPYLYVFSNFGIYILLGISVGRLILVLFRDEDISEVFSRNAPPMAIGIILNIVFMFAIKYENYVP